MTAPDQARTGPYADRMRWVEEAIASTAEWIEREREEARAGGARADPRLPGAPAGRRGGREVRRRALSRRGLEGIAPAADTTRVAGIEPEAGGSADAEWRRRRDARMRRHEERFGRLAGLTSRLEGEPQAERAWRRGAEGEREAARRLGKFLEGSGVFVLHDLRIPRGRANIDHLCVGAGGVTVLDTKAHAGKARVSRGRLMVGKRDRTKLVEGVNRQVEAVRTVLAARGYGEVDVVGGICWVESDGLPLVRRMELHGVRIDGARRLSKWAARPGPFGPDQVAGIAGIIRDALGRPPTTLSH
jgi:hypothetical protein